MSLKINKLSIPMDIVDRLVKEIKSNRKLLNLDDELVLESIKDYLKTDKKAAAKLADARGFDDIKRSKETDAIIKHVRSYFYNTYTAFQTAKNPEREKLLKELKERIDIVGLQGTLDIHRKLLMTHISTKERVDIYDRLYSDLFSITGKPKTIIDVSCGLNPLSYPYMDIDELIYIATEFNALDLEFLERYFNVISKHANIKYKTVKLDLTKHTTSLNEEADVCFMFKIIDLFDSRIIEKIMREVQAGWIIVSVSTKTIAKNDMLFRRRAGFQKMLRRLGLKYKTKEYENELFYIIEKS